MATRRSKDPNKANWPISSITGRPYNPEVHDENHVFKKGNKSSVGHYIVRRYAEIRNLIAKEVSDDDIVKIVRRAVDDATNGDAEARKWLFERMIGKPKNEEDAPTERGDGWNIVINVMDPNAIKPLEIIQTEATNKTDIPE